MKLSAGTGHGKNQTVIVIVAIVVILVAIGLIARSFLGGGGAPPGQQSPSAAPNAVTPEPTPAAQAPPPAARPAVARPAPASPTRQIKVFGSVNVTYPSKWKISAGAGNSSAIFTDGNASLAIHPPDPKADSAKKIAQAAITRLTPGAVVTKEGAANVSGYDTYWYAVRFQGKVARVVGIDAPTRIALVETVKSGDFGKYAPEFDKIQSGITFGK